MGADATTLTTHFFPYDEDDLQRTEGGDPGFRIWGGSTVGDRFEDDTPFPRSAPPPA